jgi:hypothetical protein
MLLSLFHEDGSIFRNVIIIRSSGLLNSSLLSYVESVYVDKYITGLYFDTWEYVKYLECYREIGFTIIDRRKYRA